MRISFIAFLTDNIRHEWDFQRVIVSFNFHAKTKLKAAQFEIILKTLKALKIIRIWNMNIETVEQHHFSHAYHLFAHIHLHFTDTNTNKVTPCHTPKLREKLKKNLLHLFVCICLTLFHYFIFYIFLLFIYMIFFVSSIFLYIVYI